MLQFTHSFGLGEKARIEPGQFTLVSHLSRALTRVPYITLNDDFSAASMQFDFYLCLYISLMYVRHATCF